MVLMMRGWSAGRNNEQPVMLAMLGVPGEHQELAGAPMPSVTPVNADDTAQLMLVMLARSECYIPLCTRVYSGPGSKHNRNDVHGNPEILLVRASPTLAFTFRLNLQQLQGDAGRLFIINNPHRPAAALHRTLICFITKYTYTLLVGRA